MQLQNKCSIWEDHRFTRMRAWGWSIGSWTTKRQSKPKSMAVLLAEVPGIAEAWQRGNG